MMSDSIGRRPGKSGKARATLFIVSLLFSAHEAVAAGKGRVEINQARALAGGVTASDTPGFPVVIDRPGSYVLTSDLDLSVVPSPHLTSAIRIEADFVTLDLGGFTIRSTNVCTGTFDGCTFGNNAPAIHAVNYPTYGVVVRNGSIVGATGTAVALAYATGARVERVDVRHAGYQGVSGGAACQVAATRVELVGRRGVYLGEGSRLAASAVARVGELGAVIGDGSLVRGNRISESVGRGLGCAANPPGPDYALAANVFVGNNGGGSQFFVSCGNEIDLNRCGADTSCP